LRVGRFPVFGGLFIEVRMSESTETDRSAEAGLLFRVDWGALAGLSAFLNVHPQGVALG
jgi:hypothetical protein